MGTTCAAHYATDQESGEYQATETPSYGTDSLGDFFKKVSVEGLAGQELGDQAVFK
jgi:divinyl chlorophyllide a 8-vinyl-reductase